MPFRTARLAEFADPIVRVRGKEHDVTPSMGGLHGTPSATPNALNGLMQVHALGIPHRIPLCHYNA